MDGPAAEVARLEGLTGAQLIGAGGFGLVYRAHQASLGRDVAVKVARSALADPAARSRFESECRAIGALSSHPGVVTVFSSGFTDEGRPYLVMEYLPGGTLAERVAEQGPRPWAEVARAGTQLGDALAAAHAEGRLHRDVKPENALISGFGDVKLADFGLAQLIEGGGTGPVAVTVVHAAPELFADDPRPTTASDIFALGSTLYTLLAGLPPFARPGESSVLPLVHRISTAPVPDLRPQGVPDPFCGLIEAALAKDPAARPSSAQAFADGCRRLEQPGTTGTVTASAALAVDVDPERTIVRAGGFAPDALAPGSSPIRRRWVRPTALIAGLLLLAGGSAAAVVVLHDGPDNSEAVRTASAAGAAVPAAGASEDTTVTATSAPSVPATPPTVGEDLAGTAVTQVPRVEELDDFPELTSLAQPADVGSVDQPRFLEPTTKGPDLLVGADQTCLDDAGTAPVTCALADGSGGWFAMAVWSSDPDDTDCLIGRDDPCAEITLYGAADEPGHFSQVATTDLDGYDAYLVIVIPFTSGGEEVLAAHTASGGANRIGYVEAATWEDGDEPRVVALASDAGLVGRGPDGNGGTATGRMPRAHRDGVLLVDYRDRELLDLRRSADGDWSSYAL